MFVCVWSCVTKRGNTWRSCSILHATTVPLPLPQSLPLCMWSRLNVMLIHGKCGGFQGLPDWFLVIQWVIDAKNPSAFMHSCPRWKLAQYWSLVSKYYQCIPCMLRWRPGFQNANDHGGFFWGRGLNDNGWKLHRKCSPRVSTYIVDHIHSLLPRVVSHCKSRPSMFRNSFLQMCWNTSDYLHDTHHCTTQTIHVWH